MNWRPLVSMSLVLASAWLGGCSSTGFVQLSQAASPTPASQAIPIFASKEIGRPYRVLGYVFRTTAGHREGMLPESPGVYVLQQNSEEVMDLRRMAAMKGADAIVGVAIYPAFNMLGQATGVSVGGLAVKFEPEVGAGPPSPAQTPTTSPPVSSVPVGSTQPKQSAPTSSPAPNR